MLDPVFVTLENTLLVESVIPQGIVISRDLKVMVLLRVWSEQC